MPHAIVEVSPLSEIGVSESDLLDAVFDGMQSVCLDYRNVLQCRLADAAPTREALDEAVAPEWGSSNRLSGSQTLREGNCYLHRKPPTP